MQIEDVSLLPAIEQSGSELFRTATDLAWIADEDNLSEERHLEFLSGGACWVAETSKAGLVAFLAAQVAGDTLHIWELSVARDFQRQGIGHALLLQATGFSRAQNLHAMTLTTFRDVPWNEPMYRRLGFETLQPGDCGERLAAILDGERAAGLPIERRCAMRLLLGDGPGMHRGKPV